MLVVPNAQTGGTQCSVPNAQTLRREIHLPQLRLASLRQLRVIDHIGNAAGDEFNRDRSQQQTHDALKGAQ